LGPQDGVVNGDGTSQCFQLLACSAGWGVTDR